MSDMNEIPTVELKSGELVRAEETAADGLLTIAQAYVIDCPEMAEAAADDLGGIKRKLKDLDDLRMSMTRPLDESKKRIMALFEVPRSKLVKAESVLKGALITWNEAERRRIEAERRAAEEAARKEAERIRREAEEQARKEREEAARLQAEAEAAAAAGNDDAALDMVTQAEAKGEWGQWVADKDAGVKGLKSGEGREALMYMLMNWDLSGWDPTKPVPVTDEMMDLVDASPTQNESVGVELYEELLATGKSWFWVDPATTRKSKTIFHDLTLLVKENGGHKLKASIRRGEKIVKGNIYIFKSGTFKTRIDESDGSHCLAAYQVEPKDLAISGVEVEQLFTSLVEGIKGSMKY